MQKILYIRTKNRVIPSEVEGSAVAACGECRPNHLVEISLPFLPQIRKTVYRYRSRH